MIGRSGGALALAAMCALFPPAAASAGRWAPPRAPADAPVVAETPSGARMLAFDRKRKLCTVLALRREEGAYADCERPDYSLRHIGFSTTFTRGRVYYSAVVASEVAAVEFVYRGGRRVLTPTSPGEAYGGRYAGKVAFLLAEVRGRRLDRGNNWEPRYLRLLDAAGDLIAIANASAETRVGPLRTLARGRTAGAPWAFRALGQRSLVPLPGDQERFVDHSCVEVRRLGRMRPRTIGGSVRSLAKACVNPEAGEGYGLGLDQQCDRLGLVATGIVPAGTRSVVAVLGDGRTRRLQLLRLPSGHRRAFALVAGRNVALRRLVVRGARGGRQVAMSGVAPGSVRCGADGNVVYGFSFGHEPGIPTGPLGFRVYDEGVRICATLGLRTGRPQQCGYAPVVPEDSWVLSRTEGEVKLLAGIVPAQVGRVIVELGDGRRLPVDTQPTGVYSGRYAGALRFFTLELPAGTRVATVRTVDARGRRARVRYLEDPLALGPERLVLDGPPGLRLRAQLLAYPELGGQFLCVRLGPGDCDGGAAFAPTVTADCRPRRLVFWGVLSRRWSGVTIETDRGDFRARFRRLPPALRPDYPRRERAYIPVSAFLVALPAHARPTAFEISGRRTHRQPLRLPSAAEQCGYDYWLF